MSRTSVEYALWRRKFLGRKEIATLDDDFVAEAQAEVRLSHIERNRAAVGKALTSYAAQEARLVEEIAARTEELRQVRVSISALSQADSVLEQGAQQIAAE
jgi:Arc/MetJ family transcription regulator